MILIIVKGTVVFLVAGPGIMGNVFVLVNYVYIFWGASRKKSIHMILMHLVFANIIILLCNTVPNIATVLGLRNFLSDIGCHLAVYLQRVARGLTICTSSLLTVVQAVTMSPRGSMWDRLRPRSAWNVLPIFPFFWILNCFISMNLLQHMRNSNSLNKSQFDITGSYCDFLVENQMMNRFFLALMGLRDALFLMLMAGASVYLALLLHQHHKHVLHLQSPRQMGQTPHEVRAAQSVLLLMVCFLSFYGTECIASLYIARNFDNKTLAFIAVEILSLGYATFCPFVLIHRYLAGYWHNH